MRVKETSMMRRDILEAKTLGSLIINYTTEHKSEANLI